MTTYRKFDQYRSDNRFSVLFDDFFNAAGVTATGTGTPAVAVDADGIGGVITLTTTAGANDTTVIQSYDGAAKTTPLTFRAGKKFSFVAGFALVSPDPFTGTVRAGLMNSAANPASGVFVEIATTGAVTIKSGTGTLLTGTVIGRVADTSVVLEIYYDGGDSAMFFVNGYRVGKLPVSETLLSAALSPTIALVNTSAAARSIAADFIGLAVER